MKRSLIWPIVILASALAIGLDTAGNITSPIRPYLAFWFLLVCPGMSFIILLGINNWLSKLTLAVALSIGIDLLVAETMVLAGRYSPEPALLIIIAISTLGVIMQLRSSLRMPASNEN